MKTEITHEELIAAYAPIWDAAQMLRARTTPSEFGDIKTKLETAQVPLARLIKKIEEENLAQFG